jgi:hypothetical protein
MKPPIRSLAGRILATSEDAEEKSLAAYVLSDPPSETETERKRSPKRRAIRHSGDTEMADAKHIKDEDKVTDPKRIDVDAAKAVVEQDRADSKDGVARERTEAGIVLEPQSPDRSVATYNPADVKYAEERKPEKSPYVSGEPVHDRS